MVQQKTKTIKDKVNSQNVLAIWQKIVILRFHNGSTNVFVNTGDGNWFFMFLIMFSKYVS